MAVNAEQMINLQKLAHTTGYQNNCGLNALIHKIDFANAPAAAKARLYRAFLPHYGLAENECSQDEFFAAIHSLKGRDQDPGILEIFLGPVFRKMLPPNLQGTEMLAADHLIHLANDFGYYLEAYNEGQVDEDGQLVNHIAAVPQHVLGEERRRIKLWLKNQHWHYEELNDAERNLHNGFYNENSPASIKRFPYNYRKHDFELVAAIKKAFKEKKALKAAFDEFDAEQRKKSSVYAPYDDIFDGIFNSSGRKAKSNKKRDANSESNNKQIFMQGLREGFAKMKNNTSGGSFAQLLGHIGESGLGLIGLIGGFVSSLSGLAKKIGKGLNPGGSLTDDEIMENEETAYEAADFKDFSDLIGNLGTTKSRIATKFLNEAWRKDPNSVEAWEKLMEGLSENGQPEEMEKCLVKRESALLKKLYQLEGGQNSALGANAEESRNIKLLRKYRDDFLKPCTASNLTGTLRQEQMKTRLEMLREMNKVLSADNNKVSHENLLSDLESEISKLSAQNNAPANSAPANNAQNANSARNNQAAANDPTDPANGENHPLHQIYRARAGIAPLVGNGPAAPAETLAQKLARLQAEAQKLRNEVLPSDDIQRQSAQIGVYDNISRILTAYEDKQKAHQAAQAAAQAQVLQNRSQSANEASASPNSNEAVLSAGGA